MKPLTLYTPDQLGSGEPPDLSFAAYRFLAEGDSWFTVSTLNPARNGNLLNAMQFEKFACAVNCATPGDTLAHMVDMNRDPVFRQILCGPRAYTWDGLLLSCGGNDLIDALQVSDAAVPRDQRLLLQAADWGPVSEGPARYLSAEGWKTFCDYLQANLAHMLHLRDDGPSRGCPAFIHGYAYPTPRPAGAALSGPWLMPALQAHGIPPADWEAIGTALMNQLGALLAATAADGLRFPNLHYFDSCAVPIVRAQAGASGVSGDWENEIHLTRGGYEKVAGEWARAIEGVMA